MTAPEPTAVERTIAGVDEAHQFAEWVEVGRDLYQRTCTCGYRLDSQDEDHLHADMRRHRAQAVVAAIRNLPPAEMAELVGGEVRQYMARRIYEKPPLNGYDGSHVHVVGPWREVRDV